MAEPRPKGSGGAKVRKLVLVVDDDVEFRRDICEALEAEGYSTIAASNGRDALGVLVVGRLRPSAIVLDVNMPEMDGIEFRRWLSLQPHLRSVPVVVVSGFLYPASPDLGKPVATLLKPFSPDDLIETVRTAAS